MPVERVDHDRHARARSLWSGVFGPIGVVAAILAASTACTEPCEDCLVILPVGDSLTRGKDAYPSYRYFLAESLEQADVPVDFVGTRFGAGGRAAGDPPEVAASYDEDAFPNAWDQDHEGRGGATLQELADHLADWDDRIRPDVDLVLLMAGTNDVLDAMATADSVEHLGQLTDALGSTFQEAHVVVAAPPPVEGHEQAHAQLVLALDEHSANAGLLFIDMSAGFDATTMRLDDGVHLNDEGDRFVADTWLQAIELELDGLVP